MRLPGDVLRDDPSIGTVTIALNYVCNSRCTFCFIEREIEARTPDTSLEFVERVFAENRRRGLYKRLILAGAEATLRKDLPEIAHRARKVGGFEHVRLQTNGRRLADRRYLMSLLAAGIDEYFISVHAGTAEQDALLTRNGKSFAEMREGLRQCKELGVRRISNSVVTARSVDRLDELVDFLVAEDVPECHLWAFIEFGDVGQREEHVAYATSMPKVRAATARLLAAGRQVTLSWFPECLLGDHSRLQVNHRDTTLIDDAFADRARSNGQFSCVHASSCSRFGKSCMGLHERHVTVIGDEASALTPLS